MKRLVVLLAVLALIIVPAAACNWEDEKAKLHAIQDMVQIGDLVEINLDGHKLMAAVARFDQPLGPPSIILRRFEGDEYSIPPGDFTKSVIKVHRKDDPDFGEAARRYFLKQ